MTPTSIRSQALSRSRWARILRENLTAYAFILPAMTLLFLFGIFPVAFSFFVSLHRWRRFPDVYLGLDQYVRAVDGLAYVIFFWLALGALAYAGIILRGLWRRRGDRALPYLLPGIVNGAAILLAIRWFSVFLPIVLNIPQRLRGQERVQGLFVRELVASFGVPESVEAGSVALIAAVIALVVSVLALRFIRGADRGVSLFWSTAAAVMIGIGVLIFQLTANAVSAAVAAAQTNGEALPLWSQIILISAGVVLVALAFVVWTRGVRQAGDRRFTVMGLAALLLLIGGVILALELPRALTNADPNVLSGFAITVMFALGTVPFQLAIGLGLAYLLFQNIRGRSFFRVVYFLPYVMPFVATSVVFNQIFSHRPESLANHVLNFFGIPDQKWLLEPTGINELIFGAGVPDVLAGPGLALIVIMIYTTWTYIGYDAAIFLAGLGNIPEEMYEAARIDGASGWSIFRHITLPLLSPTTFFLSLIAIIGTFQAFTQIWIMRTTASQRAVDTLGVYIFETVRTTDPNMGYGSAMSFALFGVILLLTIFQNRIAGSRVFYG
jgi:multiple sugar transport system permease protein